LAAFRRHTVEAADYRWKNNFTSSVAPVLDTTIALDTAARH
jgi:hypothetical protein